MIRGRQPLEHDGTSMAWELSYVSAHKEFYPLPASLIVFQVWSWNAFILKTELSCSAHSAALAAQIRHP